MGYRSKTKTVFVCRRCTPSNNKERRKDEACDEGLSITTILRLSREGNRASTATSLYIFETFWTSRLQTVKITGTTFNPTQRKVSDEYIFLYRVWGRTESTWISLLNLTDSIFLQEQHLLFSLRVSTGDNADKIRNTWVEGTLCLEIRPTLWRVYFSLSFVNIIYKLQGSMELVMINNYTMKNSIMVHIFAKKSRWKYVMIGISL